MIALLKYWQFAVGAIGAFVITWAIHNHIVSNMEADFKDQLAAQVQFDIAKCNDDKQITTEISHGLQNSLDIANHKLASLKLQKPSRCVVPASSTATGHDANSTKPIVSGQNGVTSDALYDFAGDAEKERLKLTACQGFITKTWKSHQ